jgi:hypothetical protein
VFFFIDSKDDVNVDGMFFTAMPLDFDRGGSYPVFLIFFVLAAVGCISYLYSPTLKTSSLTAPSFPSKKMTSAKQDMFILLVLIVLTVFSILHFATIDYDTFWFNYDYQVIKTPELISHGSGGIFRLYHFIFRIISLFIAIILIYYIKNFSFLHVALSLFVFMYGFLFLYVSESRWVIVYIAVLFLSRIMILNSKPKILERCFWFTFFIFIFVKVIYARNYGLYGLSVQADIFIDVMSLDLFSVFTGLFINLGEGFLGLANVVQGEYWYPDSYKFLSFSPFPSFIDGFASIQYYEHRISFHVPFNSISEAYTFGVVYFCFYLAVIYLFLYSSDLAYSQAGVLFKSILLAIVLWNVFYMFGYPLRNVIRMFEYFIVINLFIYFRAKIKN